MKRNGGDGRPAGRDGGKPGRGKHSGRGKPGSYGGRPGGGNGDLPRSGRGERPGSGPQGARGKGPGHGPARGPDKNAPRPAGPWAKESRPGGSGRDSRPTGPWAKDTRPGGPGARDGRQGGWDRNDRSPGNSPQGRPERAGQGPGHRPGGKAAGIPGRAPSIKPSKAALGQLLARYGVRLQPPTLDQLWAYHQLLRTHNHDQDLTRLIGFDTIAQRHYADCMILHGFMNGRWPSPLVDVGSGAGFPGLMIKLMSPSTRIVLAEPRPRRVQFLEMVIRELGLKDISVFGHKVTSRSLTQPFAGAITRAFETVEKTLPRFGSCLGVGGKAIFMKGPKAAEEVAAFKSDEYKIIRNHAYRIPNTQQDRVLLILERIKVPEPGQAVYDASQEEDMAGEGSQDGGAPLSDPGDG